MSDYQFEVGREYRTRNGLPCVLLSDDGNVGRVWKVLTSHGEWVVSSEKFASECWKPLLPERTIDQTAFVDMEFRREVVYGTRGEEYTVGDRSSCVRWTIGSDGKPAYAVRLDESGEPMYRVEPVK